MRRRLDIPPLPFLQPDGAFYHLDADGTLIPYTDGVDGFDEHSEGQELGSMPSHGLSSAQDYVARARYLAGSHSQHSEPQTPASEFAPLDARRAIAKLERATTELRQGILGEMIGASRTPLDLTISPR